jgi:hypothetical protein
MAVHPRRAPVRSQASIPTERSERHRGARPARPASSHRSRRLTGRARRRSAGLFLLRLPLDAPNDGDLGHDLFGLP